MQCVHVIAVIFEGKLSRSMEGAVHVHQVKDLTWMDINFVWVIMAAFRREILQHSAHRCRRRKPMSTVDLCVSLVQNIQELKMEIHIVRQIFVWLVKAWTWMALVVQYTHTSLLSLPMWLLSLLMWLPNPHMYRLKHLCRLDQPPLASPITQISQPQIGVMPLIW